MSHEKTGRRTDTWGIVIITDEEVAQETLPLEDRIPDELEGVPVQIIPVQIAEMRKVFTHIGTGETHFGYTMDVISKNRELFEQHPYSDGYTYHHPMTWGEPGNEIWGIRLYATKKVYNRGLSPTVRIPECLENVPVFFEES